MPTWIKLGKCCFYYANGFKYCKTVFCFDSLDGKFRMPLYKYDLPNLKNILMVLDYTCNLFIYFYKTSFFINLHICVPYCMYVFVHEQYSAGNRMCQHFFQ